MTQIAIDGPAGAGKSSVARKVASRLGLQYLDTGAMYRSITFLAIHKDIDFNNGEEIAEAARRCNLEIRFDETAGSLIRLDGEDITDEIRSSEINKHVSVISQHPEVRDVLVLLQQRIADKSSDIVMEGRDIGTNVLKQADYKFFVSASIDERARRRWQEMLNKGVNVPLDDVKAEIAMRDRIDQGREVSPLSVAKDAKVIDTTLYTEDEVVEKILDSIVISGKKVNSVQGKKSAKEVG